MVRDYATGPSVSQDEMGPVELPPPVGFIPFDNSEWLAAQRGNRPAPAKDRSGHIPAYLTLPPSKLNRGQLYAYKRRRQIEKRGQLALDPHCRKCQCELTEKTAQLYDWQVHCLKCAQELNRKHESQRAAELRQQRAERDTDFLHSRIRQARLDLALSKCASPVFDDTSMLPAEHQAPSDTFDPSRPAPLAKLLKPRPAA